MRLCVLGNSHVAALKLGYRGNDAIFFASPSRTLRTLQPQAGELISTDPDVRRRLAKSSGGTESIRVADFDAFLVVGCVLGFASATGIYKSHRLSRHVEDGEQVISEAALRKAAHGLIAQSLARRLADLLRSIGARNVAIVPEPLPTATVVSARPWLANEEIGTTLMEVYLHSLADVPHELIEQPAHTKLGMFTRREFSNPSGPGSTQFCEPYHMNGYYGAEVMAQVEKHFSMI